MTHAQDDDEHRHHDERVGAPEREPDEPHGANSSWGTGRPRRDGAKPPALVSPLEGARPIYGLDRLILAGISRAGPTHGAPPPAVFRRGRRGAAFRPGRAKRLRDRAAAAQPANPGPRDRARGPAVRSSRRRVELTPAGRHLPEGTRAAYSKRSSWRRARPSGRASAKAGASPSAISASLAYSGLTELLRAFRARYPASS